MKIRHRGFLLFPDFFFPVLTEHSVERSALGSVACAGFLCAVVSQKHLVDLSYLGTAFPCIPKLLRGVAVSTSPGAAFEQGLAKPSPRGSFVSGSLGSLLLSCALHVFVQV